MAGRESIEALAVHFTAGVAAGTLLLRLPANLSVLASSLLFTLAALVIILLKTNRSGLLFPAFLLLGAFCAFTEAFPGAELHYDPLSVSIGCHIGPGAVAVGVSLC